MKNFKSPLNIALCVLTAILCLTLLVALCFWVVYADCPTNSVASAAKDVCNVVLPLIGISVMCIVISVRSNPGHGKR